VRALGFGSGSGAHAQAKLAAAPGCASASPTAINQTTSETISAASPPHVLPRTSKSFEVGAVLVFACPSQTDADADTSMSDSLYDSYNRFHCC
jgi:hypothetical protein